MANRKEFVCSRCNTPTSLSASNFSYQKRKFGIVICSSCMTIDKNKRLSTIQSQKLKNQQKNSDTITIKCDGCKKERKILVGTNKKSQTNLCKSCAAKQSRDNHKDTYIKLSDARKNNNEFASKVSNGLFKLGHDRLTAAAKIASSYWQDPIKRQNILSKRDTEEYRSAISHGLTKPDTRKKLSENAKNHWKKLWQLPEFREKMAKVRSLQTNNISKIQLSLYDYLDDLKIEYKKEHPIGPWTFDCYIPSQRLLIECQGDYWHSQPKAIRNDKAKSTYISEYFSDHKILYLFEHDFATKDYVLDRLKYELHLTQPEILMINFKKIEMKVVEATVINEFMYKYHYLGPRNHATNFAFYYEDKLIACCSYSGVNRKETAIRLGYSPNDIRELCRFCIHPNYHTPNLASNCLAKTIKWIKKNKTWKCLVSFADPAMSHSGTIYRASNWKLDGETFPSYFYINNENFVMHKKTLWNQAIKNKMTEKAYALKFGYTKIETPPKLRFTYSLV